MRDPRFSSGGEEHLSRDLTTLLSEHLNDLLEKTSNDITELFAERLLESNYRPTTVEAWFDDNRRPLITLEACLI
jgi:hypothetical protein